MFAYYPLEGAVAVADTQNLSFEQCLTYWTPPDAGWVCTDQWVIPYHGLKAAAWAPHLSGGVNTSTMTSDTLFAIAPGASATASGQVQSDGACGIYSGRVSIEWRNGGASNGFTEGNLVESYPRTWRISTATGVAPAGTTHARIICRATFSPQFGRCGMIAFDDCRFAYG